jgi:hypothetical protein
VIAQGRVARERETKITEEVEERKRNETLPIDQLTIQPPEPAQLLAFFIFRVFLLQKREYDSIFYCITGKTKEVGWNSLPAFSCLDNKRLQNTTKTQGG